jgi:hypothetical protein
MTGYRLEVEIMISVGSIKKKLEKKSRTQKVSITMMIFAGVLLFYAIGIATNFFGQPMFSMFFIISEETAHNLVVYIAIGAAISIGALTLAMNFLKKSKSSSFQIPIMPAIPMVQKPVKTVESVILEVSSMPEVTVPEIKKKPISVTQSAEILKVETVREPTIQQIPKIEGTKTTNKGKFTCPSCKKEFSTPMLMLHYLNPKTARVRNYCPYCFKPID